MSSTASVLIDPLSELSSTYDSSIQSKIDFLLLNYVYFPNIFSSSNCSKVIISPVFSWDDVAYRMYNTNGRVPSAYEYEHEVYANALENVLSNTTSFEEPCFV